jgi:hypothetical protein
MTNKVLKEHQSMRRPTTQALEYTVSVKKSSYFSEEEVEEDKQNEDDLGLTVDKEG